ncbi:MAG: hypothetical protein PF637_09180 [Spirochaetes bacterium]|jgi:nitrogen regulatory protein PII|nr:hypothetical protein [Spirochaetota bacterium]
MSSKAVVTKSNRKGRGKRKVNLSRLHAAMNKLATDAVDKEIVKRFKILIDTSDEDLTKVRVDEILKNPQKVEINTFHESLQPYVKHLLFLEKKKSK